MNKWLQDNWQIIAAGVILSLGVWATTQATAQTFEGPVPSPSSKILVVHEVQKGETCMGITARYAHLGKPLGPKGCLKALKAAGRPIMVTVYLTRPHVEEGILYAGDVLVLDEHGWMVGP